MNILIREFTASDISEASAIWNDVVADGVAFPQLDLLDAETAKDFFMKQSFTGIAYDTEDNKIMGLYILHPNNVGRCGHICNASYAVVSHCMTKARELGFKILQFNAVVSTNSAALSLYEKLGFTRLGVIPGGFLMKDGHYGDIIPHYVVL